LRIAKAKADVVVAVAWRVVVTVSRPTVAGVVVPTATAQHTVVAGCAGFSFSG